MAVISTLHPIIHAKFYRITKPINYSITRSDAGFFTFIPFLDLMTYAHDIGESVSKLKLLLMQKFDELNVLDAKEDEEEHTGLEVRQQAFLYNHIWKED